MKSPENPGRCVRMKVTPARWDSAGGSPEEVSCSHPDSETGSCDADSCPYMGADPMTEGDAYERARWQATY